MTKPRPKRLAVIFSWAAIAVYGLFLASSYDALPRRVASHFNASGAADGFQSKPAFAITSVGVAMFLATLFTVAPGIMRKTPNGLINIPQRDHWLAPERREATLARLAVYNDWLGFGTVAMTCALFVLIVRANLHDQQLGASSWLLIGAFLVFALSHTVVLVRAFRRRN